ncbi:MAG: fumarylacetoacetate hydrolase family protein, partial [Wenzhouxiangellaceae bacterium]
MSIPGWQPPVLKIAAGGGLAVRHAWCIGRNYAAHAREMGADPEREPPVFFSKPATALVQCSEIHYPPLTGELHHEVELVAFLGAGGRDLSSKQAQDCISAFAVGCDLTRRDVQARAKAGGQPWALAKGFDQSGPVGELVLSSAWQPEAGRVIELAVNGETRQHA